MAAAMITTITNAAVPMRAAALDSNEADTSEKQESIDILSEDVLTYGQLKYTVSDGQVTIVGCDENLKDVLIPEEIDGMPVIKIGAKAFYCSNIEKIEIPRNVTDIEKYAFQGCIFLSDIKLLGMITNIGQNAFDTCSSLTEIKLPDSVTNIDENAFYNCSNLKTINIPDGVISIKACTFDRCSSLTYIEIPESVTEIGPNAFCDCECLSEIKIPKAVKSIGISAFQDCSSLTYIEIPQNVNMIEYGTFYNCNSLKNITIMGDIKEIGNYAFYNCGSLEYIKIPESVTYLGAGAFDGCISLVDIEVPKSIESIEDSTFFECTKLKSIELPENITNIGGQAFSNCRSLKKLKLPKGVIKIGSRALDGCTSLTEIEIPKGVTYIGTYVFRDCDNLTNIEIANGINKIERGTFYGCNNLTTVKLPENIKRIEQDAFRECGNLRNIYIPCCLEYVETAAFSGCNLLSDVYYEGMKENWNKINFNNLNDTLINAKIHFNEHQGIASNTPITIIDAVRKYTSGTINDRYNNIMNTPDYSVEERARRLFEEFKFKGMSDWNELRDFLNDSFYEREAYNTLITDDMYTANDFYEFVNGHIGVKATLLASSLVFSGELKDWMDFETYALSDYPGVVKYKELLLNFMQYNKDDIEIASIMTTVETLLNKTTKTTKELMLGKLKQFKTKDEMLKFLNSKEFTDVMIDEESFVKDANGKIIVKELKFSEKSGFGKFAEALKITDTIFSGADLAIDTLQDFCELDSKLALYQQYETFLTDVMYAKDELPFQMRWAANQLLDDMNEGEWALLKDTAVKLVHFIVDKGGLTDATKDTVLESVGFSSFSEISAVVDVTSWVINKLVDVGEMVKDSAITQGYAMLGNYYKNRLISSADAFVKEETENNAWEFYYDYVTLRNLRIAGEKYYLKMNDMKGLLGFLGKNQYEKKFAVAQEILSILDKCEFIETSDTTSETEKHIYETKKIIKCPVDVEVYDRLGNLLLTMKDGEESDVTNDLGRFLVLYNAYTDDYMKIVCLKKKDSCDIKLIAEADGLVDYVESSSDSDTAKSFDNVVVSKGDTILIKSDGSSSASLERTNKQDGKQETVEISLSDKKASENVAVTGITLNSSETMHAGYTLTLQPTVAPANASEQELQWFSSDERIASVKNGVVTAYKSGNVTITCVTIDGKYNASCSITVLDHIFENSVCNVCGNTAAAESSFTSMISKNEDQVVIKVVNNTNTSRSGICIVARYDYMGRMVGTENINVSLESDQYIQFARDNSSEFRYRIFVVEGQDKMIPVAASAEVSEIPFEM